MPRFLERKLKAEYGAHSAIPYKVMNSIGAMRGNKETAKGRAMEAKHQRDVARPAKAAKPAQPARAVGSHPHKNLGAYLHPKKR